MLFLLRKAPALGILGITIQWGLTVMAIDLSLDSTGKSARAEGHCLQNISKG